jgi:hypothetical protein
MFFLCKECTFAWHLPLTTQSVRCNAQLPVMDIVECFNPEEWVGSCCKDVDVVMEESKDHNPTKIKKNKRKSADKEIISAPRPRRQRLVDAHNTTSQSHEELEDAEDKEFEAKLMSTTQRLSASMEKTMMGREEKVLPHEHFNEWLSLESVFARFVQQFDDADELLTSTTNAKIYQAVFMGLRMVGFTRSAAQCEAEKIMPKIILLVPDAFKFDLLLPSQFLGIISLISFNYSPEASTRTDLVRRLIHFVVETFSK